MESLKSMHQQILHNVEMVQDRSSKILQEQEKDLLRAFRARLFDVQVKGGALDIGIVRYFYCFFLFGFWEAKDLEGRPKTAVFS